MNQDKYLVKEECNDKGQPTYREYGDGNKEYYQYAGPIMEIRTVRKDDKWLVAKFNDIKMTRESTNIHGLCVTRYYKEMMSYGNRKPICIHREIHGISEKYFPKRFIELLDQYPFDLNPKTLENGDIEISCDESRDNEFVEYSRNDTFLIKLSKVNENETEKT